MGNPQAPATRILDVGLWGLSWGETAAPLKAVNICLAAQYTIIFRIIQVHQLPTNVQHTPNASLQGLRVYAVLHLVELLWIVARRINRPVNTNAFLQYNQCTVVV
mmetsp:Transcript_26068/g.34216  ORF Transcript_26068/g.34216 Transcript_26068/m.34216 type:complete len:105 (+) Transcript_26068:297-611(+)